MHDPRLQHLVAAMDELVLAEGPETADLAEDLDRVLLRLRCLSARLGDRAAASPYLGFLRRVVGETGVGGASLARTA